ncbi:MAG: glycosyltransferase family 2 protein [Hymenobacter sp.]|nr:MAG: glycosyltransferase family 2 protein [Hymenobacter sp.]
MLEIVPKVSVVIPNYNHERYLPQRIESVLQQTYQDIEILILDDCSPDNSREVIERYAALDNRIRVVYNEQNSGSTFKQWNKAFALVRGKYIWIAESDDYAAPDLLASLVAQLEKDAEVGLAYCGSNTVDENNGPLAVLDDFYTDLDPVLWTKDFVLPGRSLITDFMSYRNIIPNASAVVMRRSRVEQIGGADDSFRLNGDWIFWASLIADTKVAFVARKLNYFRFHLNNVRSKTAVNGVALSELTRVVRIMQQYGKPKDLFLDRMIRTLTDMWFVGIVANNIPLKKHREIFANLKAIDANFGLRFRQYIRQYILNDKFKGLRALLGINRIYTIGRK